MSVFLLGLTTSYISVQRESRGYLAEQSFTLIFLSESSLCVIRGYGVTLLVLTVVVHLHMSNDPSTVPLVEPNVHRLLTSDIVHVELRHQYRVHLQFLKRVFVTALQILPSLYFRYLPCVRHVHHVGGN